MLLDDTNYSAWKDYIQQRLQSEGLLAITLGNEVVPEQGDGKEMEEYKKKSRLAFYLLIKAIEDSVVFSVSALNFENNPRELWMALKTKYFPGDLNGKLEAMRGLRSVKWKNNPETFIEQIRTHFENIERAGFEFDEPTWMVLFLSQLPRNLSDSITKPDDTQDEAAQGPPITSCEQLFEKLKSSPFTATGYPQNQNSTNSTHNQNSSNYTQNQNSTKYPQNQNMNEKPKYGNHVLQCTQCHKKGHDVDHCWFLHPERNPFYQGKDQGSGPNGATSGPPKKFYNGNQSNGPPGPNKYFNKNQNNNNFQSHHNRADSNSNSNAGNGWSTVDRKPFKPKSSGANNGDWRAPNREQSTSNQSGWNDSPQVAAPTTQASAAPANNATGWNDTTENPANYANESGWTDSVQEFQTLPTPSGWGEPHD